MSPYFQPRLPYRFTNTAGSSEFVFPLADYTMEAEQGLRTPSAILTGAQGEVDLLGDGVAPRNAGKVRIGVTVYEEDPEDVDSVISEMMDKLARFGRGKLWSKGTVSGSEVLYWTRARLVDSMPPLRWTTGDVLSKSAAFIFRTDPFWYPSTELSAAAGAATGTLTVVDQPTAGDTLTVGATVYTFVASGDFNAAGEIPIGGDVATTRASIVAAINGTDGQNSANASASAAAFSGTTCLVTALLSGDRGNAVAFSETFTSASNVTNGSGFLGGSTAGSGSPYAPGSFVVNNPGNAPIYDAIITVDGTYSAPEIENTTTGHRLVSTGSGTKIRFDAGGPKVERWNGSSWVNDYANFAPESNQIQLMVLEPGDNNFTTSGVTGLVHVDGYAAYTVS